MANAETDEGAIVGYTARYYGGLVDLLARYKAIRMKWIVMARRIAFQRAAFV